MLYPDLSIILQGPFNIENHEVIVRNCRNWRNIFPSSEIILSISTSDILGLSLDANTLRLDPMRDRPSHSITLAVSSLNTLCDSFALCDTLDSLPPIKKDKNSPNSINYQIKAAKNGLNKATREYALRIRNDCVFLSDKFITEYKKNATYPRGNRTALTERVMIPSIYTLNPYARERMPFHFSDWFHFGLRADIVKIWDIPEYSFADAVHYALTPYAPHSNSHERKFITRLAVEQYIVYKSFSIFFPDINLDYHNDLRSIKESIDILCDNFIVCDARSVDLYFPKYQSEIEDRNNASKCINNHVWQMLSAHRSGDYGQNITQWNETRKDETWFMQTSYRPLDFLLRDSSLARGNIENTGSTGLLVYGPYVDLVPGRYRCHLSFTALRGPGRLRFSVTSNVGKSVLSKRNARIWSKKSDETFTLDFKLSRAETDVEFVIRYSGMKHISFAGMRLEKL